MVKLYLIIGLVFFYLRGNAQSLYFPPTSGGNWDTISPESLGWCRDKITPLYNYLGSRNTKAFIVLKNGKIVMEKYFGTFSKDSLWYWASAGKTLTSFVVGVAQQEGYLSINNVSSLYLKKGWSECPPAKEDLITVRNHLTMTTGLNDGVPDNHCTLDTCLNYLTDAGKRWAYHNGPYTLLDKVIEGATGQNLNLYLASKLRTPIGMNGGFIKLGYDNVFISNARSMARFGLLMLNKGIWDGVPIMKDTAYFSQMIQPSQTLNNAYGYLWWLNGKKNYMVPGTQFVFPGYLNAHAPEDMYAALGKNAQLLNIVPSENLVFIRMGNSPNNLEVPFLLNDSIWMKLNDVICFTGKVKKVFDGKPEIVISPNPSKNSINIHNKDRLFIDRICVLNSQGKIILEPEIKSSEDEISINVSGQTSGIYFVRIQFSSGTVIRKAFID